MLKIRKEAIVITLEHNLKQAALERAVLRAVSHGQTRPDRSARNLAQLAAILYHTPPPDPHSKLIPKLAQAISSGDASRSLQLINLEFLP